MGSERYFSGCGNTFNRNHPIVWGLRDDRRWYVVADTNRPPLADSFAPGQEPLLESQQSLRLGPQTVALLVGR